MPSFYQHIVLAVAAVIVILAVAQPQYASLLLAFLAAAVFPDVDSKNSTVRRSVSMFVPAVLSFFAVFNTDASVEARVSAGVVTLFAAHIAMGSLPLSHRGRHSLHRMLPMLLVSAAIGAAVWMVFKIPGIWMLVLAALLGYATHMAADRLLN
ncbi:MAG: metal-dependent hydrolase [Candidatus Aenigmarchaeota archaeon]|nr:metal-dependent hydrolase [Candidatus Aenigmarchaeota archaeon]